MADYIDRKELRAAMHKFGFAAPDMTVTEFVEEELPAADVAPVVHGRWEDSIDEWFGTDVYTCSKCRESYVLVEGTPKENLWHYFPNCGAKMNGGDGDAVD